MTADQRSWLRAGVSVVAYLAACFGLVVIGRGPLIVRVMAVFAVGLLASRLQRVVRREFGRLHGLPRQCWRLVGAVFAIGVGLGVAWLGTRQDGVGFCSLALLYVAIGLGLEELRSREHPSPVVFGSVLAASVGLALIGLAWAALGHSRGWWAFWLAVLLAPIGISLVSELGLHRLRHHSLSRSLVLAGVGAALLAAAIGVVVLAGLDATYVLALAAFLVVLMVGIAARSNTDVIFVVVEVQAVGQVGVNFLGANSVSGTLEQSLNPTRWVHNSLHPNTRGHEAMRSALAAWLAGSPDLSPPPADPPPTPPSPRRAGAVCLDRTGQDLDTCANQWTSRHAAQYLLTRGWILAPALFGAWLIALQLIRLWRVVFDDPGQPYASLRD